MDDGATRNEPGAIDRSTGSRCRFRCCSSPNDLWEVGGWGWREPGVAQGAVIRQECAKAGGDVFSSNIELGHSRGGRIVINDAELIAYSLYDEKAPEAGTGKADPATMSQQAGRHSKCHLIHPPYICVV